ncbi:hypothetical protein CFT12S02225_00360 [Campylobacter fetus subsp. testudinum]|uniref:TonB-dependent receptor n=1 Tax=Campylobacter fetus subsp. testudinum TaxID=1507806 RepID=A0AAX0HD31_CAMFE|nr:TonB-dependent receptor [Campylobacter fetus]OCR91550.1 hypothetical protein CFT12S02225_00360 [Campylobacter fetus subsp. testudinum]
MRFSSVIASSLLCATALNAQTTSDSVVVLDKISVSSKIEKNILDEPTKVEVAGKETILESPDLAKSLLNVSGFSMTRKGGGGSEILYRSQGAGRLPIFIDNSLLHGGCGGRMDTAVTYISPENYRSVRIIKGPQDVRFGALISGAVLFDRDMLRLSETTFNGNLNALYGSFDRRETSVNLLGGNELGSLQATGGIYKSGDYKDGDGNDVHSKYSKKTGALIATFTPLDDTALSFSADFGSGKAAYADRAMDGVKFDRTSFGVGLEQGFGEHQLNMQAFYHEIDHVMDNFSLRPNANKGNSYSYSNPKREIKGVRAEGVLNFDDLTGYIGASYSTDEHSSRNGMGSGGGIVTNLVSNMPYRKNAVIDYTSGFAQGEYIEGDYGVFSGVRIDHVSIDKYNAGQLATSKDQNPVSAFVRYEHYLNDLTLYAGLGHAQRVADFWEFSKVGGMDLNKEKNSQIDLGSVLKNENSELSFNLFASKIDDYIMLRYDTATSAFNTDVMMLGGELDGEILLQNLFKIGGGASYTYGKNLKNTNGLNDGDPLPQISPLAFRFLVGLEQKSWFANAQFYANAAQHRYKEGYGNAIGKDLGYSDNFWTVGLYGGYKYKNYQFLVAAENLNNALYSYHNSKNGAAISTLDIPATTRVYEPGRSFWVKFKAHF